MAEAKRPPRHNHRLARGGELSKLTNFEKRAKCLCRNCLCHFLSYNYKRSCLLNSHPHKSTLYPKKPDAIGSTDLERIPR